MATRGTIAMQYPDGQIKMIYSHWDNYLGHTGKILLNHFSDLDKVNELINLGDVSVIKSEIGHKHPFSNPFPYKTREYNLFNQQYGNWCKFYGRDRGETNTEFRLYRDLQEYEKNAASEEYNYIFRPENNIYKWYVKYYKIYSFVSLKKAIEDEAYELSELDE